MINGNALLHIREHSLRASDSALLVTEETWAENEVCVVMLVSVEG